MAPEEELLPIVLLEIRRFPPLALIPLTADVEVLAVWKRKLVMTLPVMRVVSKEDVTNEQLIPFIVGVNVAVLVRYCIAEPPALGCVPPMELLEMVCPPVFVEPDTRMWLMVALPVNVRAVVW
jgi:hypothetical protein